MHRRRDIETITLALVCFALAASAQELSPEVLSVAHAMTTNRDLLKALPLYTCLETIQRARPGASGKPKARDVVQLDVGVSVKREIYSWPDDPSFSPMDLSELVGHGLLATGLFSGFARDLFVSGNGMVRAAGEETIEGRRALRFTYRTQRRGRFAGRAGTVSYRRQASSG